MILIEHWGDCPPEGDCVGDLNGDGNVGAADLVILIRGWGSCDGAEARLDIKPASCPNPLNRDSNGLLPVALVGSKGFDANDVDITTLLLSRADGEGGEVAPGPQTEIEDVATPFGGELCDCHELEGDGIDDVSMHFVKSDVVEVLELDKVPDGTLLELCCHTRSFHGFLLYKRAAWSE